MSRKILVGLFLSFLLLCGGMAGAATLTFDDSANLGVNLGGGMTWAGYYSSGANHLAMDYWENTDYIYFDSATLVNDFQMNYQPWEGYGDDPAYDSGWLVDIKAFDSSNNVVWSQYVDLTSTAYDWSEWITVSVNTEDIVALSFGPTGGGYDNGYSPTGYWPSIDNLRINEASAVPEPSTMLLLGCGIFGLAGVARKRMTK